jgi:hypothetical protein
MNTIELLKELGLDSSALVKALEAKKHDVDKAAAAVTAARAALAKAQSDLAARVERYNAAARMLGMPLLADDGQPADKSAGWLHNRLATFNGRRTGEMDTIRARLKRKNTPSRALQFIASCLIAAGDKEVILPPIPSSADSSDNIDAAVAAVIPRHVLLAAYKAADSDMAAGAAIEYISSAAAAEWPAIVAGLKRPR